jgi:3-methyladenine DNA glycosylase AlkD
MLKIMDAYIGKIKNIFRTAGNPDNAGPMKAYMKNQFDFLGIKSTERRELSKPFLIRSSLPPKEQIWSVIRELWALPEREFQYFSMLLAEKYNRVAEKDWIDHYANMITQKSWWDTVDFIAINLVGNYFMKFPERIPRITDQWMRSGNIWLERSCLLFQLKYKIRTNTDFLDSFIQPLANSKEFFIAKAIGWALREYSKTNPEWVNSYIQNHELRPLSKKEGLKRISRSI